MAYPVNPYPFPRNVHVISYVTLKLNSSNYLLWKTQFESLLLCQKLLGFVNGETTPPQATRIVEDQYQADSDNEGGVIISKKINKKIRFNS